MARGNAAALAPWRAFSAPYIRTYGFREGLKKASDAYHGHRGHRSPVVRRNPGPNLGKLVFIGALAFGAYKLYQSGQQAKQAAATKNQIPPYPALGTQMGL